MTDTPRIVWAASLTVAAAAVYATAHGLYGVAVASGVPPAVAVVYPVLADGLALVAYASTRRLTDGGRRYAWTVVVLAAGLSGAAQAAWLAGGVGAAPWLRAGVGGLPAVAAVTAAHLVYLAAPRHEVAAPAQAKQRQAAQTEHDARTKLGPRPALDRDDTPTVAPTRTKPTPLNSPVTDTDAARLRDDDGLSWAEIRQRMGGKGETTARRAVRRGRDEIRNQSALHAVK